jgi:hypothetical protein
MTSLIADWHISRQLQFPRRSADSLLQPFVCDRREVLQEISNAPTQKSNGSRRQVAATDLAQTNAATANDEHF